MRFDNYELEQLVDPLHEFYLKQVDYDKKTYEFSTIRKLRSFYQPYADKLIEMFDYHKKTRNLIDSIIIEANKWRIAIDSDPSRFKSLIDFLIYSVLREKNFDELFDYIEKYYNKFGENECQFFVLFFKIAADSKWVEDHLNGTVVGYLFSRIASEQTRFVRRITTEKLELFEETKDKNIKLSNFSQELWDYSYSSFIHLYKQSIQNIIGDNFTKDERVLDYLDGHLERHRESMPVDRVYANTQLTYTWLLCCFANASKKSITKILKLVSSNGEERAMALFSLLSMKKDSLPILIELAQNDNSDLFKEAKISLNILSPEYYRILTNNINIVGIELMGNRSFDIMDTLVRFYQIGEICKKNQTSYFKQSAMGQSLGNKVDGRTVGLSISAVSDFFHVYYREFKGLHIPSDSDESLPNPHECKLFERGQGKRGTIIYKLGWEAWELTRQYLARWNPQSIEATAEN